MGRSGRRRRSQNESRTTPKPSRNTQYLVQMQVKRPEVAAVVARGDADDAGPAGGPDADARGLLDGAAVERRR